MLSETRHAFLPLALVSLCILWPWSVHLQAATISVDADSVLSPVNHLIFGNAQPFGHGDALLQPGTTSFEPQALDYALALRPTVLRFPGGIHADEYYWEDGIGPLHLRPVPRPGQYEPFGFAYGVDEHMALCELVGAEAFLTVNYGTGILDGCLSTSAPLSQRIDRAADWVEYCNSPNDGSNPNGGVEWAALRAQNGHPEPYEVKFWEIGNEICGGQQTGHTDVETYAQDLIAFSRAMKAVDPDILIGAVGSIAPHWRTFWNHSTLEWNATLLQIAGEAMDFLVVHCHYPGITTIDGIDLYRAGMAGADQALIDLQEIRNIIDQEASPDIAIVPGENGFTAGVEEHWELCASLLAGLHLADLLMMLLEHSSALNIPFACGWTLHSQTFGGDIAHRWSPERRFATPEYYAQRMFREHFGDLLVYNSVECGTFSTEEVVKVTAQPDVPALSVSASLDSSGTKLYLMVVNRLIEEDVAASIQITEFEPQSQAHLWTLNGADITANNESQPDAVKIAAAMLPGVSDSFEVTFPAHSLTAMELRRSAGDPSNATPGNSEDPSDLMPSSHKLWQNFPNPFNSSTILRYRLPREVFARLQIYNSLGQLVRTVVAEQQPPGEYQVSWDGRDLSGQEVASGVYFCLLQADDFHQTCKLTVLR